MSVIEITELSSPGLEVYSSLTEHELKGMNDSGIFIAESPKVIRTALECGYQPISLLCERKHITGDAASIINLNPELTVYTGERDVLSKLTGYKLTRGVLCAMKRKPLPEAKRICSDSTTVCVLEAVCDTTNIGSIFRSAAALGIGGILLTTDTCDPLNRRAVRVSMGTVLRIPWTYDPNPISILKQNGFKTVALTLDKDSISLENEEIKKADKIALVLGTEGEGLSKKITIDCDYKAIIPMFNSVDSLNVGAAAAIAFWEISKHRNSR